MKHTIKIKSKFLIGDIVTTKANIHYKLVVFKIAIDCDGVLTYTVWDGVENTYDTYFGWQLKKNSATSSFTQEKDTH